MNLSTQIFAFLAALLHVMIFLLESIWFMRPSVYKRFGATTRKDAEAKRLFAFNQGFYNLFLAVGIFVGLAVLQSGGNRVVAQTLVLFCCFSMFCAGLVLLFSGGRRMVRAAVMQALFPLLAWSTWFLI
ncbi:MAG: DUF1304 domain-containing protein [Candidatus Thiodiazotropha lotti]|nr:DUF1304 domain-containing protein [Candidatus Thiodiazotropha lotti]